MSKKTIRTKNWTFRNCCTINCSHIVISESLHLPILANGRTESRALSQYCKYIHTYFSVYAFPYLISPWDCQKSDRTHPRYTLTIPSRTYTRTTVIYLQFTFFNFRNWWFFHSHCPAICSNHYFIQFQIIREIKHSQWASRLKIT